MASCGVFGLWPMSDLANLNRSKDAAVEVAPSIFKRTKRCACIVVDASNEERCDYPSGSMRNAWARLVGALRNVREHLREAWRGIIANGGAHMT